MSIITKGLSNSSNIVTQGYTSTLAIVVTPDVPSVFPTGGGGGGYIHRIDTGLIQTKKIKVLQVKKQIEVDVLLINYKDFKNIDVIVEQMQQIYGKVDVFLEGEVEYD